MDQQMDQQRDRSADPRIYAQAVKESTASIDYMLDTAQFSYSRGENHPIPNDDVDTPIVVVEPVCKKTGGYPCKCNPCIQGPSCKS